MKSFAFNLLPQKPRSIVKKESNRDDYSVLVTILPLIGVILWLVLVLVNNMVIENYKKTWEDSIESKTDFINYDLVPVLMKHGEIVLKTQNLADVITKDIKPEQLFVLLDEIYANQDLSFKIVGYGRKEDGSFQVTVQADNYLRLAEVTRKFSSYKYITDVKIDNASLEEINNKVTGIISFFFNYEISAEQ